MNKPKDDDANWRSLCQTEPPQRINSEQKRSNKPIQIAPVEDKNLDF